MRVRPYLFFKKIIKICFLVKFVETKKQNLSLVYYIAFIGDLTLSTVIVGCILYATNIGLTTIEVGLIGGAYGFTYIVMPAVLGKISDNFSRKISLTIAVSGQMILMIYFLFIITQISDFIFFGLFFGLLLFGIMYGFFWPSIEAYISENTESSHREHEKGISNFCISWSFGYALGPLFAGFFSDFNILFVFIIAFLFYISSFCLIFFKLPYIKPKHKNNATNNLSKSGENISSNNQLKQYSHSNKILLLLLMGVMTYSIVSKVLLSYFTNYAALPEGLNWTGTLIGQVMFFFGLGRSFYFLIARYFKNSFSAITYSFLFISIFLFTLAFFYPPILVSIILFIIGFFVGRTYLVSLELILKFEKEKKGAKAGLFESIVGIGSALSPLISGIIATIDLKMPFFIFAFIVFLFLIIHLYFKKNIQFENFNEP
ncbi:MAG: MFS transporter [Promethearchaeota archaeon]|nr:MAG: MFS transporter [Candidatus Lokiarchaeota archaeon]